MKKNPKETKQQFLDNDMIAKKRKDYFAGPHGIGQNSPGGEMESPRAQIIDEIKQQDPRPNSGGITYKGD